MLQEPTSDFNFDNITLGPPNGLQGGSYFTKLLNNNEPIYLQVPKCLTKQGMVVTEKKKYCDLMFTRDASDVIYWFENIEKRVHGLLYEKKNVWFHEDLELSDIENAFTSPIRSYKSGYYYLVRCSIPKVISPETISCYNENEEPISLEEMGERDVEIIPLIEIQGVKFSSKSFQIEIGLRQVMVIKKKHIFQNCLIKVNKNIEAEDDVDTAEQVQAEQVKQSRSKQSRSKQSRSKQSRSKQSRSRKSRSKQSRSKQSRFKQSRSKQSRSKQSRSKQSRSKQSRSKQSRSKQSRFKQSRSKQSRSKQSRSKQSRSRQIRKKKILRNLLPLNYKKFQLILLRKVSPLF